MNDFTADLLAGVTVKRTNGTCTYGERLAINHADVPSWVAELVADEIAENELDAGEVEQGGSRWVWSKA